MTGRMVTMGRRARADEFTAYAGQAQQRLFRQAVLLTGDPDSARDLVQSTLVKVYVAWPRIDTPAAYTQRTMVRTFLDGRRRSAARRWYDEPRPEPVEIDGEQIPVMTGKGQQVPPTFP
jgi:DNA-directed RNA polymerase specialized sigma24 family protein